MGLGQCFPHRSRRSHPAPQLPDGAGSGGRPDPWTEIKQEASLPENHLKRVVPARSSSIYILRWLAGSCAQLHKEARDGQGRRSCWRTIAGAVGPHPGLVVVTRGCPPGEHEGQQVTGMQPRWLWRRPTGASPLQTFLGGDAKFLGHPRKRKKGFWGI